MSCEALNIDISYIPTSSSPSISITIRIISKRYCPHNAVVLVVHSLYRKKSEWGIIFFFFSLPFWDLTKRVNIKIFVRIWSQLIVSFPFYNILKAFFSIQNNYWAMMLQTMTFSCLYKLFPSIRTIRTISMRFCTHHALMVVVHTPYKWKSIEE